MCVIRILGHCGHLASAERASVIGGAVGEEELGIGDTPELEWQKEGCEIFELLVVAPGECRLTYPM